MTTYSHTITFDDSQHIALEAALKLMIAHCDAKISEGAGAPFWAHKDSCAQILQKLHSADSRLTSTNTFETKGA